jgi:hypothetical protein
VHTYVDKVKVYIKEVVKGDESDSNIGRVFEIAD